MAQGDVKEKKTLCSVCFRALCPPLRCPLANTVADTFVADVAHSVRSFERKTFPFLCDVHVLSLQGLADPLRLQKGQFGSLVIDGGFLLESEQSLSGSPGCSALPKSPLKSMSQIPQAGRQHL